MKWYVWTFYTVDPTEIIARFTVNEAGMEVLGLALMIALIADSLTVLVRREVHFDREAR